MNQKIIAIKGELLDEGLGSLKKVRDKENLSDEAFHLIQLLIKNYWLPEFKEEAWEELKVYLSETESAAIALWEIMPLEETRTKWDIL